LYLRITAFAKKYGLSKGTVYNWIKQGSLDHRRRGRTIFVVDQLALDEAKERFQQEQEARARAAAEEERRHIILNRARYLRLVVKKYGLSVEDFDAMMIAQCGCCDCCGAQLDDMIAIDHCHRTSMVRAIICHRCNITLGMAQDDVQRLRACADYLERHPSPTNGTTKG
jgi:hypothetical protein